MAKRNIPVGLFYASYNSDCTYELNSSLIYAPGGKEFNILSQIKLLHLRKIYGKFSFPFEHILKKLFRSRLQRHETMG